MRMPRNATLLWAHIEPTSLCTGRSANVPVLYKNPKIFIHKTQSAKTLVSADGVNTTLLRARSSYDNDIKLAGFGK